MAAMKLKILYSSLEIGSLVCPAGPYRGALRSGRRQREQGGLAGAGGGERYVEVWARAFLVVSVGRKRQSMLSGFRFG